MNKAAISLALITLSVASAFAGSFAFIFSVSSSTRKSSFSTANSTMLSPASSSATPIWENKSLPTSSVSSAPAKTAVPAPAPLADPSYPEGMDEWLPLGTFGILSPRNQTYSTDTLTLSVGGVIIVGSPYLAYSLDGAPRHPVPIELNKPDDLNVTMQRILSGSVALPPLANGAHVIVLFADLGVEGRKGKETLYFDVETP